MIDIEKVTYYNDLYDVYFELLSSKQRIYFEYYYFNDYSLAEVAEILKVSRNAVSLNISTTIKRLDDFEAKLKLLKIKKLLDLTNNLDIDNNKLKKILNDIKDMIR